MTYVGTKETGGASSTANPAVCSKCHYLATTEELIDADEQAEHEKTWLDTVREHIEETLTSPLGQTLNKRIDQLREDHEQMAHDLTSEITFRRKDFVNLRERISAVHGELRASTQEIRSRVDRLTEGNASADALMILRADLDQAVNRLAWLEKVAHEPQPVASPAEVDKLAERIKALESQAADTERFTTKVQGHTAALAKLQDETAKLRGRLGVLEERPMQEWPAMNHFDERLRNIERYFAFHDDTSDMTPEDVAKEFIEQYIKGRAEEWKSALAGAVLSAKKAPGPGPVFYKRELSGTGSLQLRDILFEAFRDWLLMYGTEEGAKLTEWSEPVLTRLVRGHNDGLNASGLFKCLTDTGHTISLLIEQNRPSSSDQRS